jgi:hypothetical protein
VRELIAVTERMAPNMECYLHGNLPAQQGGSPFAEEREETREAVAVKKEMPLPNNRATRVDVDLNGRRSLVNDMR